MFLRYFSITSGTLLAFFGALIVFYKPIEGDLSRIGYLSQNSFGPNHPQPRQKILATPAKTPSILVIGDSFSASNLWQSRLTELTGQSTTTIHWREFRKSPFCAISWAKTKHPSIRFVLIQTVEREAVARMTSLGKAQSNCNPASRFREIHLEESYEPSEKHSGLKVKDFEFLIRMTLNERKSLSQNLFLSGKSYVSKITRSDLFSSKKPDSVLFYVNDVNSRRNRTKRRISTAISSYEHFGGLISNLELLPVLLVTPDKLTIYSQYMLEEPSGSQTSFWDLLEQSSIASVPLKEELEKRVGDEIDLYIPNDTHLSIRGFQLMAEAIAENLAEEFQQN